METTTATPLVSLVDNVFKGEWKRNPKIVDLNDSRVFLRGQPHAAYDVLRRDYPIYWNEEAPDWGPGFWNVTRYEDIVEAAGIEPAGLVAGRDGGGPEQGLGAAAEIGGGLRCACAGRDCRSRHPGQPEGLPTRRLHRLPPRHTCCSGAILRHAAAKGSAELSKTGGIRRRLQA